MAKTARKAAIVVGHIASPEGPPALAVPCLMLTSFPIMSTLKKAGRGLLSGTLFVLFSKHLDKTESIDVRHFY